MSQDKKPPKGVIEVLSVSDILAKAPKGQVCGCCGVINGDDDVKCGWCGSVLASASPPPQPQLRRVGPKES